MLYNYHTHTTYCDGVDTPEEMILKAIELGFSELGFSGHTYTAFETSYCMSPEGTEEYKKEITALKEKYKGKIKILLGIECDYLSDVCLDDFEYVIGSVHSIKKGDVYFSTDGDKQEVIEAVNRFYGGDFYALIEEYYSLVADVYNRTKCDIIGHFDLITKFNEDGSLFDTKHPRYVAAWKKAADAVIKTPAVIEINAGAIARGYTTRPYPAEEIIDYFKSHGKKLIYSADCHNKEFLLCGYEQAKKHLL